MLAKEKLDKMALRADQMIGLDSKVFTRKRIIGAIRSRKIRQNPFFWNNGVLSYAINQYRELYKSSDNSNTNNLKLSTRKQKMSYIDDALYFFANYDIVRDPSAVANMIYCYPRSAGGSVQYRSTSDYVFIDSLGMICAFLLKYSKSTGDIKYHDLAILQFTNFLKNGYDKASGLPYHGFNGAENEKQGIIGWGRSVGWLLFGLSESLALVEKSDESYEQLRRQAMTLIDTVCAYQRDDGGFSWQLQAMDGPIDTSATAMIGYGIAKLSRLGILETEYAGQLAQINHCLEGYVTEDGFMEHSSAECLGFSMYPQTYTRNAWGQGFSILYFIEYMHYGKKK